MDSQIKPRSTALISSATNQLHGLKALWIFLLGFYAVWTIWAILLVRFPLVFDGAYLRNGVRLLVWVAPALVFIRWNEGPRVVDRVGLRLNACRGIAYGAIVSVIVAPILYFMRHGFGLSGFCMPTNIATWIGPIITAPIAEEIVFRGLVFRRLREQWGTMSALLISSALFALIHLPYWWLSGAKSGGDLCFSLLEIAGIGALLCGLFRWTNSLWTPLVYHVFNNFITVSFS